MTEEKQQRDKQPRENRQRFREPIICPKCQGTGSVEDMFGFYKQCPKCEAEGYIWLE